MGNAIMMCLALFKRLSRAIAVSCALAAGQALAFDQQITASFTPSLDDPTRNEFTNTTTPGIVCRTRPDACDNRKSLQGYFTVDSQRPLQADAADPRQGLALKLPAQWRDVSVRNQTTGATAKVQLRIVGLASIFGPNPSADTLTGISDPQAAHDALWRNGGLGNPPAPCAGKLGEAYDQYSYLFLWETMTEALCAKQNAFPIASVRLINPEFLYEIRTPTPLDMSAGTYEGRITYSMVPGGDFDFGDNLISDDPVANIRITLSVSHHLQVKFPPGADHLALEPEGGWIPWVQRGRRPERIFGDQPFRFTASGPVKMRVECQYLTTGHCAMRNALGHQVPVQTSITLPANMHLLTGGPVTRRALDTIDELTAAPDRYVADQPASLHFEVDRARVDEMLAFPDSKYAGNVTVVWDAFLIP